MFNPAQAHGAITLQEIQQVMEGFVSHPKDHELYLFYTG
jgi:hypothetical protein